MKMRMNKTPLDGLLVVEIDCFRDERGFFMESWHKRDFAQAGQVRIRPGFALAFNVFRAPRISLSGHANPNRQTGPVYGRPRLRRCSRSSRQFADVWTMVWY